MSVRVMLSDVGADMRRLKHRLQLGSLTILMFQPGFLATMTYRLGHAIRTSRRFRSFPYRIIWAGYLLIQRYSEILTGIYIDPAFSIGRGAFMPHFGGIVIMGTIGENCDIHQGVTVGFAGARPGTPTIGDRVYIGAGAKIFGPITIGDDAVIGANAVVTRSVPDRGVAVGIPARVVSHKGSFDMIRYPAQTEDQGRRASLAKRDLAEATDASTGR